MRTFNPDLIDQRAFRYYERLGRLDQYVSQHYEQPISLGIAAGIAALERTYFSKFFHAKTGVCFHDWLAHVRISNAKELLRSRNFTITETALSVGFNDLRTFERTFQKCAGLTPLDYKKSVRPG